MNHCGTILIENAEWHVIGHLAEIIGNRCNCKGALYRDFNIRTLHVNIRLPVHWSKHVYGTSGSNHEQAQILSFIE